MAGDWIKMRVDLHDDPAVIGIAEATKLDVYAVVGRLWCVWSWADQQLRDGDAKRVTPAWLDDKVKHQGFAKAMAEVGWLKILSTGLSFPNFDKHNGKPAKERALTSQRMRRLRDAKTVTTPSTEKRREEVLINTSTVTIGTAPPRPPAEPRFSNSNSTPRAGAHSTARVAQNHADLEHATKTKAEPPGGSVADFVKQATGKPLQTKPGNGAHNWASTSEGLDEQGERLGMQRLKLELDEAYLARIQARLALG